MHSKIALIISLKPLKPVKSGMQNTIFLLKEYLEKKGMKCMFIHVNTTNKIDPIIDLKYKKKISQLIEKQIFKLNPNFIFINTTKLLYTYRNIFFIKNKKFLTILVSHDLYCFRKKYIKKVRIKDNTPMSISSEIDIIKKSDYIIDISHEEKNYLLNKKINNKKLLFTKTPIKINKLLKSDYSYDFVFIGSNWFQNIMSLNYLYKKIISKFPDKKFLVMGMNKNLSYKKNVTFKNYNINNLSKCKYGLAFLQYGSGRKVKIFEMLAHGIPVVTNINLKMFGLKNNQHYIYTKNIKDCYNNINCTLNDDNLRNQISKNSYSWSLRNSNYLKAFKPLDVIF
tara:strand:- start:203 stop:1219 length:1017 start_codon:yes stop_codon:yes gene_type:complete